MCGRRRLVAIGDLFALRLVQDGGASELGGRRDGAVRLESPRRCGQSEVGRQPGPLMPTPCVISCRSWVPVFIAGDIDEYVSGVCVPHRADHGRGGTGGGRRAVGRAGAGVGVMGRWQLAARIDKIVAGVDLDAVRRRRSGWPGARSSWAMSTTAWPNSAPPCSPRTGSPSPTVDRLGATVCEGDPRTLAQRRADALGALAAGAERLCCRCGPSDCPAGGRWPGR